MSVKVGIFSDMHILGNYHFVSYHICGVYDVLMYIIQISLEKLIINITVHSDDEY